MNAVDKIIECVKAIQDDVLFQPYYSFNYWFDAAKDLNDKNLTMATQNQKYPLILIPPQIWETEDHETNFNTADVTLFIITETQKILPGTTNQPVDQEWRKDNIFPGLRIIKDNLIQSFEDKSVILDNIKSNEIYYEIEKKNKLNSCIDIIQLDIGSFEYFKNC